MIPEKLFVSFKLALLWIIHVHHNLQQGNLNRNSYIGWVSLEIIGVDVPVLVTRTKPLDISRSCISSWYTCVSCHWYDNHQSTEEYFKDLTLKWTTHGKIGNTISEQQKLSQKIVGPFDPNNPLHASMNKQCKWHMKWFMRHFGKPYSCIVTFYM